MIIQPYSSLFETPRVQISREAYENSGIGIFSAEKIPFANRTGPEFAQNLVDLFVARVKSLQKSDRSFSNGIHIYELGAGTGILAKRVLDLLKNNHPKIYRQIVLHVSDISKETVAQLKALAVFIVPVITLASLDLKKWPRVPSYLSFPDCSNSMPCKMLLLVPL